MLFMAVDDKEKKEREMWGEKASSRSIRRIRCLCASYALMGTTAT